MTVLNLNVFLKSRHHLKPFNEYCRVLKSRYQFVNLMTLVDLIVF